MKRPFVNSCNSRFHISLFRFAKAAAVPDMQHIDFNGDSGVVLLFPPVPQGKTMAGHEKTLIPQGDKGIVKLAPPAGFTNKA